MFIGTAYPLWSRAEFAARYHMASASSKLKEAIDMRGES
jgi:hypothetical protein